MSKKQQWICVIGSTIAALIFLSCIFYAVNRWSSRTMEAKLSENGMGEVQAEEISDAAVKTEYLYQVRTYRGHIGIYNADGSLYSEVMLPLARLPEQDLRQLEEGINVYTQKELDALMEDLTG